MIDKLLRVRRARCGSTLPATVPWSTCPRISLFQCASEVGDHRPDELDCGSRVSEHDFDRGIASGSGRCRYEPLRDDRQQSQ